ncbi:MAG: acyl-phosphate glycerol 3-phosphate acyltransferase [Clostridiales bacterium GWB2_37_7]|nr:MAG: acyl-phosphate glycerol 3-phosphate acyltransferase [Clostridiales bacterium GWB2_37_7]
MDSTILRYVLVSVIAYFLGNFATSYIVSMRSAHIDIRKHGSGNAGATNVLRVLGAKAAAATFIGDALKGVAAVLIGRYIAGSNGAILAGLFVVVGHNWPVVLGFRGGKGVATTIGSLLAINPLLVSIVFAMAVIVLITTKYVSLASITGMVIFPIAMIAFKQSKEYIAFSVIIAILAIFKHRTNIIRLINGTESKLGKKAKAE